MNKIRLTNLCFLFFILYHLPSLSILQPDSMTPSVPTFPEKTFPSASSHCASFPSFFYLSLSLMLSFDSQRSTFNGSYLLIKYLQVSAVLWQEWGDKERWRQKEGAVAGVVQALSDMTYSQIYLCKI